MGQVLSGKAADPIMLSTEDAEKSPEDIVAQMTLEQKLGQIFQVDWRSMRSVAIVDALPLSWAQPMLSQVTGNAPLTESSAPVKAAFTKGCLASVLGGGGAHPDPNAPPAWREQAEALQRAADRSALGAAELPLLIANDSVHGQANLHGATLFQHHIGQGCMRNARGEPDVELVEELAALAARESFACGINWVFSPCLAVPQDLRWGRTYEGFGEDPSLVGALGAAEVRGLQTSSGVPVMGCAKHWVGDGGTAFGTGGEDFAWTGAPKRVLDQGDTKLSEDELRKVHMAPYLPSLAEGVHSVMVSYSSINGVQMHAHRHLVRDVLKGELAYEGIVISDFDALPRLRASATASTEADAKAGIGCPPRLDGMDAGSTVPPLHRSGVLAFADAACASLNSGVDMIMSSGGMFGGPSLATQIEAVRKLVQQGKVPQARIDDAARRVIRVRQILRKQAQALELQAKAKEPPAPSSPQAALLPAVNDCVGCAAHRALARKAAARSAVLLVNEGGALPLAPPTVPPSKGASSAGAGSFGAVTSVIVTGIGAHDLGVQCGGWSGEWQGSKGNGWTEGGTTIWEALHAELGDAAVLCPEASQAVNAVHTARTNAQLLAALQAGNGGGADGEAAVAPPPPLVVVVGGEPPYAEGGGDTLEASLSVVDRSLVQELSEAGARVVLVLCCGRPLAIPQKTLTRLSALCVCWLPGTEGTGVADVLVGRVPFTGKLSFSWPRDGSQARYHQRQAPSDALFPRGFGLTTAMTH